jgi:hypothetical protein
VEVLVDDDAAELADRALDVVDQVRASGPALVESLRDLVRVGRLVLGRRRARPRR